MNDALWIIGLFLAVVISGVSAQWLIYRFRSHRDLAEFERRWDAREREAAHRLLAKPDAERCLQMRTPAPEWQRPNTVFWDQEKQCWRRKETLGWDDGTNS